MIPNDLRYTEEHEWVRVDADGVAVVGITQHAQDSLGDIVYVDLPGEGDEFEKNDVFGSVESVKAVSDLYMPLAGEIVELNEALDDEPELVNAEPYEGGWLVKVKLANPEDIEHLLDADAYEALLSE